MFGGIYCLISLLLGYVYLVYSVILESRVSVGGFALKGGFLIYVTRLEGQGLFHVKQVHVGKTFKSKN
jgi:hypothetical protein